MVDESFIAVLAFLQIVTAMGWLGRVIFFLSAAGPGAGAFTPPALLEFLTEVGPKQTSFSGVEAEHLCVRLALFFANFGADYSSWPKYIEACFGFGLIAVLVTIPTPRRVDKNRLPGDERTARASPSRAPQASQEGQHGNGGALPFALAGTGLYGQQRSLCLDEQTPLSGVTRLTASLGSDADVRRLAIMVDYLFGSGVSRALPKEGFRLHYSRKSGRVKTVFHDGKLFATVKPNGAMALSVTGASMLARSPRFRQNCVQVSDDVAEFVTGGKSVFCKFVRWAGKNVYPRSEVAIIDGSGKVIGVGLAILNGATMAQFKSGAAVKVRAGLT